MSIFNIKGAVLLTAVAVCLSGCGERTAEEDLQAESTEDIVTTFTVDLSPKLETTSGEAFEGSPVADFSLYGESYVASHFYMISSEDGENEELFKAGDMCESVEVAAEFSNDNVECDINGDGSFHFSFEGGDVRGLLALLDSGEYHLLFEDYTGYNPLMLNGSSVVLTASYTSIPLSEFAKHAEVSESEAAAMIKDGTVFGNEGCASELAKISGILTDWASFTDNVRAYAESESALLPAEYVSKALAAEEEREALKEEEKMRALTEIGAVRMLASQEIYV